MKLLEVLPVQDRKWIKIDNPVTNTFWDVLKQILTYVETETSLKLTIEDIDKEQKAKSGTYEVNNTQNASGNNQSQKQSSQQASGKGQSSNSGNNPSNKQNSNPNAGKQCNYCHNKGHVIAECRKNCGQNQTIKILRITIKITRITIMATTLNTIQIRTKAMVTTKITLDVIFAILKVTS